MKIISEWTNKYNAFNGLKCLVHVKYWDSIKDGIIPYPIFISIDPINLCNFDCRFCNAKMSISKGKNKHALTIEMIDKIVNILEKWKTKAVCIAGGGEPLLNPNTSYLIKKLHSKNIKIGLITNGYRLDQFVYDLKYCEWVGISIDAAKNTTYSKIKNVPLSTFQKIIDNIKTVSAHKICSCDAPEITYKFLIHPLNYREIFDASYLAKQIGCNTIHIRPGGDPWFTKKGEFNFTKKQIETAKNLIEKSRKLEDESFKVYGIMHKFTNTWEPRKSFVNCYAIYTTMYIAPNGKVGLCCDRRGDPILELSDIDSIDTDWGGPKHLELLNKIDVNKCPRCTYTPVNEIFENVILKDKMLYDFI